MGDTQEALKNAPQDGHPADLERTLSDLQREFQSELSKTQQKKAVLSEALPNREKAVEGHLSRARAYYAKKEWSRAFAEWDKVCMYLDENDEFRKKVAALKESHENLLKVNREVSEIKTVLNQRSAPSPADRKFVQSSHEEVSGQVKNVYSYLGQQLRTERTPKTLSFWWPISIAMLLLGAGVVGLFSYYGKTRMELSQLSQKSSEQQNRELAALQTERESFAKKAAALKDDYEKKIAELKEQNAGWRNAGRERIEELETQLKETELKNNELSAKIEKLAQDNIDKDRLIAELTRS